jgi:copper(I)-binding protein
MKCARSLGSGGPDGCGNDAFPGRAARPIYSFLKGNCLGRWIAAIALGLTLAACGQGAGRLAVEHAEFHPPLSSNGIGVAYFSVISDKADRITGVSSTEAAKVEIHTSVTTGDQVSMKRLDSVELPAGKAVTFEPRGMHLMVFSPHWVNPDATFPITFTLESGRNETVPFHPALMGQ